MIFLNMLRLTRMRTNFLLACVCLLGVYMLLFDKRIQQGSNTQQISLQQRDMVYSDGDLQTGDEAEKRQKVEEYIENSHKVDHVAYKSPFKGILAADTDKLLLTGNLIKHEEQKMRYHKLWVWADNAINSHQIFQDNDDVLQVLDALHSAPIVSVDVHDVGAYESGTSEKWVITLLGGQKAMMKMVWEEKGEMKKDGACNIGYEIPSAEIAAFHLHRLLGFRNIVPVTGRRVNLITEILPVASARVAKQISQLENGSSCVTGQCYFCKRPTTMCKEDGIVEASITYWVPRHIRLYTYPPGYMPYSTPRMDEWGEVGFNNKSYCKSLRKNIEPYKYNKYYYDLFDFSVLDTLMYHYDSKHYVIHDDSTARGLTVRLDHGRAFCNRLKDDTHIFLAPVQQCCTLRRRTYEVLQEMHKTDRFLSRRLLQDMSIDPIAPILKDVWYEVLQRRLDKIIRMLDKCARANGGVENILVDDS